MTENPSKYLTWNLTVLVGTMYVACESILCYKYAVTFSTLDGAKENQMFFLPLLLSLSFPAVTGPKRYKAAKWL